MFKRGEIYLANLNPKRGNEVGKLRPVLIYQTDMLNEVAHPTTTILPLTTKLTESTWPLRFRIGQRERLEHESEVLCDQIRTIDDRRIITERVASLSMEEMLILDHQMKIVLGLE